MENNPLLEILKGKKHQQEVETYLENVKYEDFKAHILDILKKQRQKSAEKATVNYYPILDATGADGGDYMVNKKSILNAKLI